MAMTPEQSKTLLMSKGASDMVAEILSRSGIPWGAPMEESPIISVMRADQEAFHEADRRALIAHIHTLSGYELDLAVRIVRREGESDQAFRERALYGSGLD